MGKVAAMCPSTPNVRAQPGNPFVREKWPAIGTCTMATGRGGRAPAKLHLGERVEARLRHGAQFNQLSLFKSAGRDTTTLPLLSPAPGQSPSSSSYTGWGGKRDRGGSLCRNNFFLRTTLPTFARSSHSYGNFNNYTKYISGFFILNALSRYHISSTHHTTNLNTPCIIQILINERFSKHQHPRTRAQCTAVGLSFPTAFDLIARSLLST